MLCFVKFDNVFVKILHTILWYCMIFTNQIYF